MNIIFRKVSVKERLPNLNEETYLTDNGINYLDTNFIWSKPNTAYWLEEIVLPDEEEIDRYIKTKTVLGYTAAISLWKGGAEWMRSFCISPISETSGKNGI